MTEWVDRHCEFCGARSTTWWLTDRDWAKNHQHCAAQAGHNDEPPGHVRRMEEVARERAQGATLESIGWNWGISRERVRQILRDYRKYRQEQWAVRRRITLQPVDVWAVAKRPDVLAAIVEV